MNALYTFLPFTFRKYKFEFVFLPFTLRIYVANIMPNRRFQFVVFIVILLYSKKQQLLQNQNWLNIFM